MPRLLSIAAIAFVGMLGCSNIRSGDLAGTWVLKDVSRRALPAELKNAAPRIVFNASGTFIAEEMPGLLYVPAAGFPKLDSGSGAWKLVSREGKQQVQLTFEVIRGWKGALPYGVQLDISKGSLFYFLGEADEGR